MVQLREVLFEFRRVGNYIKVSAVDPVTYTEVSIVGAPSAGQAALQRVATNKLRYVLEKNGRQRRGARRRGR